MTGAAERAGGVSRRARLIIGFAACALILLLRGPLLMLSGQAALGVLLAWAAAPACRYLEHKGGFRRPLAALCALALPLGLLAAFLALLLPAVIGQIALAAGKAPEWLAAIRDFAGDADALPFLRGLNLDGLVSRAGEWLAGQAPAALSALAGAADALSRAFLAPVLAYYFLRDREMFCFRLSLFIPRKSRRRVLAALCGMRREAGDYLRGQGLVSLSVAVLTSAGFLMVGLPSWLALGLLVGVCEVIPYLGPLIAAVPVFFMTLPLGIDKVLWAMGVIFVVQQLEGMILSPRLMAGATGLHPAYVLLALSLGGFAGGVVGMLLALPLFVCLRGAARDMETFTLSILPERAKGRIIEKEKEGSP